MTAIDCAQFHDIAPDLALGLLAGNERGAALNHLVACARCRHHLEGLVQVADDLLLLAPSVEPEIGFESRVMARLAVDGAFGPGAHAPAAVNDPNLAPPTESAARAPTPAATAAATIGSASTEPAVTVSGAGMTDRAGTGPNLGATTAAPVPPAAPATIGWPTALSRRRWARPILVSLAAALIAVAGVTGLLAGFTRGRDRAIGQQAQAANQLAARTVVVRADGGRSTCQLVAFPAAGTQPARLVITLDEPGEPPSSYQVLAEPGGGPAVLVGTIAVVDGHGMLIASIPPRTGLVHGVVIMEEPNSVKYRASFEPV